MFDGSFCTKIVLEGYALHILEPIQKFCLVNGTIFEFSDLQSNLVICYRSIDNVIVLNIRSFSICKDKVCLLLRVLLKYFDTKV